MVLNLSGKYYRISDLEKEFGKSAFTFYPILNSLDGVIKIGFCYLIPEGLMPMIRKKIKHKESYTRSTASAKLHINPFLFDAFIEHGLPAMKDENGNIRIAKDYIPALKKALETIQIKYGKPESAYADEIVKLAMKGKGND